MTTYAENPPGESWRIRIKMSGLTVYVVSSTEPFMAMGTPMDLEDTTLRCVFTAVSGYGDEIGYIDWSQVQLVSWRYNYEPTDDDRKLIGELSD